MSNLKILGAQRIKALTTMLDEQEKQQIAALRGTQPSLETAQLLADEEFDASILRTQIRIAENHLRELSKQLEEKTGQRINITNSFNHQSSAWNRYNKRKNEILNGDIKEKTEAIRKEFADKKNRLWLCETLEEAKAIVGIK